ncbi:MAG: dephospho-CoA kinase [Desulfobacca sp.]|uniref:dephospho-CoA kinase n=1 Tax=Desulfobacca sp. TaxID=2067990 RepID=UPI004049A2FC
MLRVALTGGIASGKSTVAALLREAGLPVLDSDAIAREVVAPGQPAWQALRQAFGEEFFAADGTLDRAALARQIFSQPDARRRLEEIVHPWISQELQARLAALAAQGEPLVVVEIPLLYELGLESLYDVVIVVSADTAAQRDRLARRDGRPEAEIEGILAAQAPLPAKAARADFVVDNSGDAAATRRQVKKIVAALRKLLDKAG